MNKLLLNIAQTRLPVSLSGFSSSLPTCFIASLVPTCSSAFVSTTVPLTPLHKVHYRHLCTKPYRLRRLQHYKDQQQHRQQNKFTTTITTTMESTPTTTTESTPATAVDYTLYYSPTPNGMKITLALEELGLSYRISPIHIFEGDTFTPSYKAINPNSKMPALIDHTAGDLVVFESGAILEYLADKTGRFLPSPTDVKQRYAVKQWLYWQMAGFGPMLGQVGFFWKYSKEDVPVGKERYMKEALRLFEVLDTQLGKHRYIAGEEYSIADMATLFWSLAPEYYGVRERFEGFENVKRWQGELKERPAVKRAFAVPFE